ncbi:MAG: energy transducer TonB, partial [Saprospiraceae bacterium]|nr:energy transducer TonB [Saprospiraceae bacterium]
RCSEKLFFTFLSNELRYPLQAKEVGVKGTVVVQFVVDEKGVISQIEVVRDIGAGCGRESIRVINKMPEWIPGKQRGKPVKVRMRLPIKFKLLN